MFVVNVTTQKQWDEVSRFMGYTWNESNYWLSYKEKTCINLSCNMYADTEFYIEDKIKILSYDEFLFMINLHPSFTDFETNVKNWADEKGLLKPDNQWKQLAKVMEELGELSSAMLKSDTDKIKDGMGDTFVTLVILANQLGIEPMECMNLAWDEIKNRKGKNVNGTFIKEV